MKTKLDNMWIENPQHIKEIDHDKCSFKIMAMGSGTLVIGKKYLEQIKSRTKGKVHKRYILYLVQY